VSRFDPIAGKLRRFGDVENHHLLGGGFVTGHVVYERSAVFLQRLGSELTRTKDIHLKYERTTGQALKDWATLIGESVLAPSLLLVSIGIGIGILMLVALSVPYLISLPFRLVGKTDLALAIVDKGGLGFLVMFIAILALIGPFRTASRVHRENWMSKGPKTEQRAE
jgi:hypothetical protein